MLPGRRRGPQVQHMAAYLQSEALGRPRGLTSPELESPGPSGAHVCLPCDLPAQLVVRQSRTRAAAAWTVPNPGSPALSAPSDSETPVEGSLGCSWIERSGCCCLCQLASGARSCGLSIGGEPLLKASQLTSLASSCCCCGGRRVTRWAGPWSLAWESDSLPAVAASEVPAAADAVADAFPSLAQANSPEIQNERPISPTLTFCLSSRRMAEGLRRGDGAIVPRIVETLVETPIKLASDRDGGPGAFACGERTCPAG